MLTGHECGVDCMQGVVWTGGTVALQILLVTQCMYRHKDPSENRTMAKYLGSIESY